MGQPKPFYNQAQTRPSSFGWTYPPPPVQLFLLALDLSPKNMDRSDFTNQAFCDVYNASSFLEMWSWWIKIEGLRSEVV